jgi:phasin protein
MLAIFAEMNGTLLESMATAQKDWADFMHRRIKEDVAVSRQLIQCHSLADMHQIYSQYFTKAFEQYQQQSAKVVQRGQSMAEHLGDTNENGKETGRARH